MGSPCCAPREWIEGAGREGANVGQSGVAVGLHGSLDGGDFRRRLTVPHSSLVIIRRESGRARRL